MYIHMYIIVTQCLEKAWTSIQHTMYIIHYVVMKDLYFKVVLHTSMYIHARLTNDCYKPYVHVDVYVIRA